MQKSIGREEQVMHTDREGGLQTEGTAGKEPGMEACCKGVLDEERRAAWPEQSELGS